MLDDEFMAFLDELRAPILDRIETESNPLVRQWLLLRYLDELMPIKETDQHLALEALQTVPPNSPLWTFESWFHAGANNLIYSISRTAVAPEEAAAYVERVIDEHPVRGVRAQFLYAGLFTAVRTTNEETKWRYYNRLQTDHRHSDYARDARLRFDPNRRVQAGKPVPDFSFVALYDPAVTFNNESLLGTTYLIDFWGTWCGPCISEIPNLQSTYDQFKEARFEILSVAKRDDLDAIRRFREQKYPMPWMHSLVGRKRHRAVKSAFEITGYPRPILVDREGMIVAVGQELRGDKLLDAVSDLLGEDS